MATVSTMLPWILIALALANTAVAKVSPNFISCLRYFYSNVPPTRFQNLPNQAANIVPLCLMNINNPFYAALYHKGLHYPLYSAYILDNYQGSGGRQSVTFHLELQLVNPSLPDERLTQPELVNAIRVELARRNITVNVTQITDEIKNSQAVNHDYSNSSYDRGHLNPDSHHPQGADSNVTYTLANIVPMNQSLNRDQWRILEQNMRAIAGECARTYVVTGAVPGPNWISQHGTQRVNIPDLIWSAFCCVDNNNQPVKAGGSLAPNNANNVQSGYTITYLQSQLSNMLGVGIALFNNKCC